MGELITFVVEYFHADGCGIFKVEVESTSFGAAIFLANEYMAEKVPLDIIADIQRVWVHRPDKNLI